ncbi:hypothetical protein L1077_07325 [Pseudoalteromonas luteoviolacea]|uniref:hypothetical protein n=1 Tax=Pseudoalteromonas luteoviolacea TaxID=43657 RepID=UPI001F2397E0|nr:hypothetical protein [Pseudoalteromonas luteoviolacea]MCF6439235.1 hypothetical protein [Pseudoalteromonas luteoviolacea]
MEHCNSTVFVGDNFCSRCGEKVSNENKYLTLFDILPEQKELLEQYYDSSIVFTGEVIATQLYQRKIVSDEESKSYANSQNKTYSYWWIELKNKEGDIYTFSISAETKGIHTIKKGDVFSLVSPYWYQLNAPKDNIPANSMITNNDTPPCFIFHGRPRHTGEGCHQYMMKDIEKPIRGSFQIAETLGAWAFICVTLISILGISTLLAWGASLVTLAAAARLAYRCNNEKKTYQTKLEKFKALNTFISQVASISADQLGYDFAVRSVSDTDLICGGCHTRVPEGTPYCFNCGFKSTVETSESLDKSDKTSLSVSELKSSLMQQYSMNYSEQYTHKNVLRSNQVGDVKLCFLLGKVVSKEVSNTVTNKKVHTGTNSTEDKHGLTQYSNVYQTLRKSEMHGPVNIECNDGSIYTYYFDLDMLGSLNEGDWLSFGQSVATLNGETFVFREYAYNMTQDIVYHGNSLSRFEGNSCVGVWWFLGLLMLIATFFALDINDGELASVPFILFVLSSVYWRVKHKKNIKENRLQKKRVLDKFLSMKKEFIDNLEQIQTQSKNL